MGKRLDPIIQMLTFLLVFLIVCLFAAEAFFKADSVFFQAVSNMASGVLGALLGLVTGKNLQKETPSDDQTRPPNS